MLKEIKALIKGDGATYKVHEVDDQ